VGKDSTRGKVAQAVEVVEPSACRPSKERRVLATILEELPSLVFRVELEQRHTALAHAVGNAKRNFVRLLPGDRVEVELSPRDYSRGRIVRKLVDSR
jgi:translation initiation factor IF-1